MPRVIYGWDSETQTWHGPNELGERCLPDRRLLRELNLVSGKSWYGRVSLDRTSRFFVLVQDLDDCALASIYCDESKAGPCEILAVIPAARRPRLREDFAFEFLTYARFLGSVGAAAEFQLHEAITSALGESGGSLIFSIGSGLWSSDHGPALSRCVETVAVTLCQWMGQAPPRRADATRTTAGSR